MQVVYWFGLLKWRSGNVELEEDVERINPLGFFLWPQCRRLQKA